MHVLVAEQRQPVNEDRRDRRERERLVERAQVGTLAAHETPAHREAHADARARQEERRGARRARDDPEQVRRDRRGRCHLAAPGSSTSWLPSS